MKSTVSIDFFTAPAIQATRLNVMQAARGGFTTDYRLPLHEPQRAVLYSL